MGADRIDLIVEKAVRAICSQHKLRWPAADIVPLRKQIRAAVDAACGRCDTCKHWSACENPIGECALIPNREGEPIRRFECDFYCDRYCSEKNEKTGPAEATD